MSTNSQPRAGTRASHCASDLPYMTNTSKGRVFSLPDSMQSSRLAKVKSPRSIMSPLDQVDGAVRTILNRALDGHEIGWQEALRLCDTTGPDFHATVFAADEL